MADPATDHPPRPHAIAPLIERVGSFTAFVARRTGDAELAAEVVQEAMTRALAAAPSLRDDQRLVPWFWQIVRNSLVDALDRRRRLHPLPEDLDGPALAADASAALCGCLAAAIAGLPDRQRMAIELVELRGMAPEEAATALGLSRTNLKVIRHRGRLALRRRLTAVCRACAGQACRDCDCPPPPLAQAPPPPAGQDRPPRQAPPTPRPS